jgi:hypothetical protein
MLTGSTSLTFAQAQIVISQCLNAGIVPASGPKRRAMYQLNIPAAKVRVSRQPILRARAF